MADRVYTSQRRGHRRLRCSSFPVFPTGRRDHKSLEEATGGYTASDGAGTVRGFGDRAERTASVRDHEPKFRTNPRRVRIRRGGDEELGFGIAESAMLVTPVALAAIREIALFLAEDLAKALSHAAADAVAARITRLFRRDSGTPPLTDTQLQASATLWSKLHNLLSWVRRRQPCWSIRWSPT